jgi:glyoxylase-like metal-dependent hydrolase (beta-lactamase superfamily II)
MTTSPLTECLDRVGITVFERGWLSANNVLIHGCSGPTALIDSGYCSHAAQTLSLVGHALGERPLDLLLNTHLHSDHCGGNAALQQHYPALHTRIPPGQSAHVAVWDPEALSYAATGQECPRFQFEGLLRPGDRLRLGDWDWGVYGAKGHDPHSIILHQADNSILLSADALWQNGFGVVFPELEGVSAFLEVGETLDLIESLAPQWVIPGHGAAFSDVAAALDKARSRLARFQQAPETHLRHALKVLIKFKLLDWQRVEREPLLQWAMKTPYLSRHMPRSIAECREWLDRMLDELHQSRALAFEGDMVVNT